MPVRNVSNYVVAALGSILDQTYGDFEVIVIDDASSDDTVEVIGQVADDRVTVVHRERSTGDLGVALNLGLQHVRGEFVARMDGDDVSYLQRLASQVAALDGDPSLGLVGTWADMIDESGRRIGGSAPPTADAAVRIQLHYRNPFHHGSVMFRTALVSAVGGYRAGMTPAEDYDLWTRVAGRARLGNLPSVQYAQRIHASSVSSSDPVGQSSKADEVSNTMMTAALGEILPANVLKTLRTGEGSPADARRAARTLSRLRDTVRMGTAVTDSRDRDDFLTEELLRLARLSRSPGVWARALRLSPRWVLTQTARDVLQLPASR